MKKGKQHKLEAAKEKLATTQNKLALANRNQKPHSHQLTNSDYSLHEAVENNDIEKVKSLLTNKANINAENEGLKKPIDLAEKGSEMHKLLQKYANKLKVIGPNTSRVVNQEEEQQQYNNTLLTRSIQQGRS